MLCGDGSRLNVSANMYTDNAHLLRARQTNGDIIITSYTPSVCAHPARYNEYECEEQRDIASTCSIHAHIHT